MRRRNLFPPWESGYSTRHHQVCTLWRAAPIEPGLKRILSIALFLAVSAVMAAIYFSAYATGPSIYMTPPDTALPPRVVPVAGGVAVPPGTRRDFPFVLPGRLCRVTGRLGTAGAGSFSALLLRDTTFTRFQAGQAVSPEWDAAKDTAPKFDLLIMGPGTYHLFIDHEGRPGGPPVTVEAQARCR